MKQPIKIILIGIITTLFICSCGNRAESGTGAGDAAGGTAAVDNSSGAAAGANRQETETATFGAGTGSSLGTEEAALLGIEKICQVNGNGTYVSGGVWEFRDELGNAMTVGTNPNALANDYDLSAFSVNGNEASYDGSLYRSEIGIDVSGYAGDIDWQQVAGAGIQFAFLRIGYRGYTEGGLSVDSRFEQNWEGAKNNGIPVGVYFFSQAVSEEEAREEADFVIDTLNGRVPDLPVVYDPEKVSDETARTANVTGQQFTANTIAFAGRIQQGGLIPAVYANAYMEGTVFTMSDFNHLTIWYADFRDQPQSPYHFEYWQYEHQGTVPGFASDVYVDMNLHLIRN